MPDPASLPQPKAEVKADAILDAADRLFTRFGYRRTTMDDIATEAGVAKGTLYLYYPSKEALFGAIQARVIAAAERRCDEAEARGGPLAERLRGLLEAWFGLMFDRYGESDHLRELQAARVTVGREAVEGADRAYADRVTRVVAEAQARAEADLAAVDLDARGVTAALLAAARGAKYAGGAPISREAYHARLAEIARIFSAALRA